MKYISTRMSNSRSGNSRSGNSGSGNSGATASGVSAKEAILQGLAPDGGLYVPESIPVFDQKFLESLPTLSYTELAMAILRPYLDFTENELETCVNAAYASDRFSHKAVAPVVSPFCNQVSNQVSTQINNQGDIHFLELFHGPTLAFKDMALSILPHLLKVSAADISGASVASGASDISQNSKKIIILTATSGDTGKAALEAFRDIKGVSIVVFYPEKGVSSMQKRQMITQEGDNTYVFGVKGNFDDTQTGVKKIFSDPDLAGDMYKMGIKFSSANSINIGRLLPQIVYYFYAYGQLIKGKTVGKTNDKINFVVPTGNFGNILAGYYAKKMGLPIGKLICASNDNKILYDFFRTGTYDKNREFFCTISPSMDILVSSNLERLLFHATDGDSVRAMMDGLSSKGRFEIQLSLPDFYGFYSTEAETKKAIYDVGQKGYTMDPHTAVAYHAGQRYIEETGDSTRQIVISTASPYKFGSDVMDALSGNTSPVGQEVSVTEDMEIVKALSKKSGLPIPEAITQLAQKPVRHTTICPIEGMEEVVRKLLE